MGYTKNKDKLQVKSLIENSPYIDISHQWKEYLVAYSIIKMETNIKQLNINCKKIASNIKWSEWRYRLVALLVLSAIFVALFQLPYPYKVFGVFIVIIGLPLLWELITVPFFNLDIKDESNLSKIIFQVIPKNIDISNIKPLGTLKIQIYDNVTERSTTKLLGYVHIDLNEKKEGNLIIVDVESCKIFAIKKFNLKDITKYVISKNLNEDNINHLNFLEKRAENLEVRTNIDSLKRETIGLNSYSNRVREGNAKVAARKAYLAMDELYILFEDGSQFLISDLTEYARYLSNDIGK